MTIEFPKFLYHPIDAPTGRLFESGEQTKRLGPGWVATPADFPKPKAPGVPTVNVQQGVELIRKRISKTDEFLGEAMADRGVYDGWANTSREVLMMVFGDDSKNIKAFLDAPSAIAVINGARDRDAYVRSKAKNQVEILKSCIEQLEIQHIGSVADGQLDQKFGILQAPSQIEGAFRESAADDRVACLLFLDIDDFKALNTRYKEAIVDAEIFGEFQRFLKATVAERGTAYKYGGEEIVVLLPNHTLDEGILFAERIRGAVQGAPFQALGEPVRLTVSIGVAATHGKSPDYRSVLAAANEAEHTAKKMGKNRVWPPIKPVA